VATNEARRPRGTPPVRILAGQAGSDEAARTMRAYLNELAERLDTSVDPMLAERVDPAEVTPPRGDFMLVREIATAETVGFGAVRVLRPGTAEITRMWLKPDVRGRGLGRFLLRELENRARALGANDVLLAVNDQLAEACGLYRASGYRTVERFVDTPYATHFFGKSLHE